MALHLSKSKFCCGIQCPKMLWLKANNPEEYDPSVMNDSVLSTGNEVGDLAMSLFGDYVEVPFGDLGEMIATTDDLIAKGTPIIAEASFGYQGHFCSVDILKNLGNNIVELYEVKSSTSVHAIYRYDVAYQCYLLTMLGYTVQRACLVHINGEYERHGELNLLQLFTIADLTEDVLQMLPDIESKIADLVEYMNSPSEPSDDIGLHCCKPYDCGFWKYCTRHLPSPNIFDVASAHDSTKFKCYYNGIVSFEDVFNNADLPASQMIQVDHEIHSLAPHIDKAAIKEFLSTLSYPLYFLDFESFQPAVPLYDDSKPFDQIVFQYSLHYIEHEGGELKHTEFLAYPGADPRRAVAEHLCKDIPLDVCTTAYNMGFEKSRIKGLANLYPDLADHLMNIYDNIVDLMVPFRKKYYYNRAMQGSYSIKYVLPALFPNDPDLDYHNLEGVHNGGEASATFARMSVMTKDELEEFRGHLLKYCGLDTFAMVKVWEKLKEAVQ